MQGLPATKLSIVKGWRRKMLDNYDMFIQHDKEQAAYLEKLPVCVYCNDEIQDDAYYEINEEPVCEDCLNEHFRKWTDDYVE